MSSKKSNQAAELSTQNVDTSPKPLREPRYFEVAQDDQGREIVSPVSLVAVAHMRPLSIGERVARYMRTPNLQEIHDDLWDPDDQEEPFSRNVDPMSKHEDRARKAVESSHEKKRKRALQKEEEERKKEEERKAQFRRDMEELREKASTPPAPPTDGEPGARK